MSLHFFPEKTSMATLDCYEVLNQPVNELPLKCNWLFGQLDNILIKKSIWTLKGSFTRWTGVYHLPPPYWQWWGKWRCEEAWCRNGATVNPSLTYIGGFLLSQLKFLLGIFKSLGVLVQLILSSLQLLLQSYQIVLELRPVSVRAQCQGWSAGRSVSAHRRESDTHI